MHPIVCAAAGRNPVTQVSAPSEERHTAEGARHREQPAEERRSELAVLESDVRTERVAGRHIDLEAGHRTVEVAAAAGRMADIDLQEEAAVDSSHPAGEVVADHGEEDIGREEEDTVPAAGADTADHSPEAVL